ncbi:MAG: hypothetical protein ACFCVC_20145 [Acidimicrobiia bacterium]
MSTSEDPSVEPLGLGWEVALLGVILSLGAVSVMLVVAVFGGGVAPVAGSVVTTAPPPALELTRVVIGVGAAVVLAVLAGWVIWATDWLEPGVPLTDR